MPNTDRLSSMTDFQPVPTKRIEPIKSVDASASKKWRQPRGLKPLTINGDNVTKENIRDGYVQFFLHHDPTYSVDGVEASLYLKRKFSSVPKSSDLNYTAWDIFVLVEKMHHQEIKNWSQLVGQLGVTDACNKTQFAQRIKRWMHNNKIDCYFDYLFGIPYQFYASRENPTGCPVTDNRQKKKADQSDDRTATRQASATTLRHKRHSSNRRNSSPVNINGFHDVGYATSDDEHFKPLLYPGSRKRLRNANIDTHRLVKKEVGLDHANKTYEDKLSSILLQFKPQTDKGLHNGAEIKRESTHEKKERRIGSRCGGRFVRHSQNGAQDAEWNNEEIDQLDSFASSPSSPIQPQVNITLADHCQRQTPSVVTLQSVPHQLPFNDPFIKHTSMNVPFANTDFRNGNRSFTDTFTVESAYSFSSPGSEERQCADCLRLYSKIELIQQNITRVGMAVSSLEKRLATEIREKNQMLCRFDKLYSICKQYQDAYRCYQP